mmetsp:Transcript_35061/g.71502  ORF Transcript_35061/g.71502 Transcript_35061/m.71502 type:complete len:174 (-) Transcript_35061:132-653(-)
MMDSGGPETEEDEIQDLAQFVQQKPQSPMKVVVGRYTALLRELNSLREDESITIVHYLTEWTEQRTGSVRTRNELETVLANHKNIAKYIKVTDAKTAKRMGVHSVPFFEFYRGRKKVDKTSGADMYLFRETLDMIDTQRPSTPYKRGLQHSSFPCPTGSFLPVFTRPMSKFTM